MPHEIHRRDLIRIGAAAALAGHSGFAAVEPHKFFTPAEFAMVDELTELVIPADDHSPGAREANVAAYIDARLAEAFEPQWPEKWRAGLQAVDAFSRKMNDHAFMESSPRERMAVMSRLAENEKHPETPEQVFFGELKAATAHAYYTSKIGIHQEMEYKGNTMLQEFVGYEVK
jgi:gluconate 2-dehydrogenase gamma chain